MVWFGGPGQVWTMQMSGGRCRPGDSSEASAGPLRDNISCCDIPTRSAAQPSGRGLSRSKHCHAVPQPACAFLSDHKLSYLAWEWDITRDQLMTVSYPPTTADKLGSKGKYLYKKYYWMSQKMLTVKSEHDTIVEWLVCLSDVKLSYLPG